MKNTIADLTNYLFEQMQRTKALGLLHKQIRKDSAMCRQGLPDYLVTFRKPGDNPRTYPA